MGKPTNLSSKVGRPTAFKEKYCRDLIDHMSKGHSFRSFSAKVGVSRSTLYEWLSAYPDFFDAYESGYASSLLFFEKAMLDGIRGKKDKTSKGINSTLLIFALKTRFFREYGSIESIETTQKEEQKPIDISKIRDPEVLDRLCPPIEEMHRDALEMFEEAKKNLELVERMMNNPFEENKM